MTMLEETARNLEKTLFTTSHPNDLLHLCVVVFDKKHAVSFRHGPHKSYEKGQGIVLHNVVEPSLKIKPINQEFPNYSHGCGVMYPGQTYKQLGVSADRQPTWNDGTISEKRVGFFVGTSHGKRGDSGPGIFNSSGYFIGISIGTKDFVFNDLQNLPIAEVAAHHPDTQIINSDVILFAGGIIGSDFEPPKKKHSVMADPELDGRTRCKSTLGAPA
ncbi:hypothetical protein M3Y98_00186000 [Aphelenchoides besseyi]|nr:hypothetical protein M3Y98_00184300 [Aphelenchoides besseyi]KAI6186923.1 hypothetical protein M3Y98_00186000 [Aphelenchoides besseyi]KAI6200147.1 hypothetical protein M3Y96_00702200 [Aphelenchoides besseyi]KAI6200166.1 hypothetical protein M3Y96_00704100 [Aphelenchoides besseyi]